MLLTIVVGVLLAVFVVGPCGSRRRMADGGRSSTSTQACYVYPPDVPDPCAGKTCSYGARCVASLDGMVARCQCPEQCSDYGDSVGSTPICGTDGVDYRNSCELQMAACREMKDIGVKYEGKCGQYFFILIYFIAY